MSNVPACQDCKHPELCTFFGRWCDVPEATKELARKAAESQANDTRTEEEIIADGVRFICDTRFGGE